jgi:hypothetical protein
MGDMTTEPAGGNAGKGGEIDITCTPDLPNAEPMTWKEIPPIHPAAPRQRLAQHRQGSREAG